MTLRFIGETDDRALMELVALLKDAASKTPPLDLEPCGIGSFPEGEPVPHVIWSGVRGATPEADAALKELRRVLNDGARSMGHRAEKGKFVPHITLGRLRSDRAVQALVDRMGPAKIRPFGRFLVREAVLFETHEGEFGTEYTPLARFTLSARKTR